MNHNFNPKSWIESVINHFINSPENTLKNEGNDGAWGTPLVGYSNGADPIYKFYRKDIDESYLTPYDLFIEAFPEEKVNPSELTVISWVLPQTDVTKSEHRKQTRFPTESWARARIYGEEVNDKLRRYIVNALQKEGYKAIAPVFSPLWKTGKSKKYVLFSTWSERHAAYAAGLGTFGLCDGLITPKGKAMRCGSIIAKINFSPSKRPYKHHHEYCLFYSRGTCGECISRCPAGALSELGHDKIICSKYLDMTRKYVRVKYGFEGYGCGLCQTSVPCESGIP